MILMTSDHYPHNYVPLQTIVATVRQPRVPLSSSTNQIETMHQQALDKLGQIAEKLNADAVIAIRFTTITYHDQDDLITAYGTAINNHA